MLLPEKVVFFSRANLKSSRAFFLVSVCAMTLTLFSPSLTLTYTDVLLEQRDLFARATLQRIGCFGEASLSVADRIWPDGR